nr:ribosomal protein L20 [Gracilaria vermiculophylla]AHZ58219.1 ribosomal protein L20 [Gracilaria vermiculophylla]AHZ58244.1 ribosomal protein L20 [Gracilaria vermiculophylla]
MKTELLKTKSRKNKKRAFRRKSINHIRILTSKYNLFSFFISTENILLNKKVLAELISTESGVTFSLIQWKSCFYSTV